MTAMSNTLCIGPNTDLKGGGGILLKLYNS